MAFRRLMFYYVVRGLSVSREFLSVHLTWREHRVGDIVGEAVVVSGPYKARHEAKTWMEGAEAMLEVMGS